MFTTCLVCRKEFIIGTYHRCSITEDYAKDWKDIVRGRPTAPNRAFHMPFGSMDGHRCKGCPDFTFCSGHCTRLDPGPLGRP